MTFGDVKPTLCMCSMPLCASSFERIQSAIVQWSYCCPFTSGADRYSTSQLLNYIQDRPWESPSSPSGISTETGGRMTQIRNAGGSSLCTQHPYGTNSSILCAYAHAWVIYIQQILLGREYSNLTGHTLHRFYKCTNSSLCVTPVSHLSRRSSGSIRGGATGRHDERGPGMDIVGLKILFTTEKRDLEFPLTAPSLDPLEESKNLTAPVNFQPTTGATDPVLLNLRRLQRTVQHQTPGLPDTEASCACAFPGPGSTIPLG
ncbi:hypothetical protein IRJ41_018270, partial [Triplophysa rosa]